MPRPFPNSCLPISTLFPYPFTICVSILNIASFCSFKHNLLRTTEVKDLSLFQYTMHVSTPVFTTSQYHNCDYTNLVFTSS